MAIDVVDFRPSSSSPRAPPPSTMANPRVSGMVSPNFVSLRPLSLLKISKIAQNQHSLPFSTTADIPTSAGKSPIPKSNSHPPPPDQIAGIPLAGTCPDFFPANNSPHHISISDRVHSPPVDRVNSVPESVDQSKLIDQSKSAVDQANFDPAVDPNNIDPAFDQSDFDRVNLPRKGSTGNIRDASNGTDNRSQQIGKIFADAVGQNNRHIPAKEYVFDDKVRPLGALKKDGLDTVVTFSSHDIASVASKFKNCLIGKFSHAIPLARDIAIGLGKIGLVGSFRWSFLNASHIMIKCELDDDYSKLWLGTTWKINGCPMRIFKWTPQFDPKFEASIAPVWIRLPGLPMHLYDRDALYTIATAVGKPIRVDQPTALQTRLSFARICIEIDLRDTRIEEIVLDLDGRIIKQKIDYEFVPKYCSGCNHVGHDYDDCYIVGNKPRPPPPDRRPPKNTTGRQQRQCSQSRVGRGHMTEQSHPFVGRGRSKGPSFADKGKAVVTEPCVVEENNQREMDPPGDWQQVRKKKGFKETGFIPREVFSEAIKTSHTYFSPLFVPEPTDIYPTRDESTQSSSKQEATFCTEEDTETESGQYVTESEGTERQESVERIESEHSDSLPCDRISREDSSDLGPVEALPMVTAPITLPPDETSGTLPDVLCTLNRSQYENSTRRNSSAAFVPVPRGKVPTTATSERKSATYYKSTRKRIADRYRARHAIPVKNPQRMKTMPYPRISPARPKHWVGDVPGVDL